jgi:hypothetical protein
MIDFYRISTGVTGLDRLLDDLRPGDNVVFQVGQVDDYAYFAQKFALEAQRNHQQLVYFRFGQHPPLLPTAENTQCHQLDPALGFEPFSGRVRQIAAEAGEGVHYVFDCLSELLSEWSTDLMIGNFFVVTCPYLFHLNTVAYFGLLRDRHSYQTIARIRDTTQVLLDIYHRDRYCIQPLKVWQRYTPTMFLPHTMDGEVVAPLTSSADIARLLTAYPRKLEGVERKLDHWDHVFLDASDLLAVTDLTPEMREKQWERFEQLLRMVIGRDEKILALARKYLTLNDLLQIKSRLIGSGFIGGKAVGLLLARAILASDAGRKWPEILEPHDSCFIGSDVYYTYLVENDCWQLCQEQKKPSNYYSAAAVLKDRLQNGGFPETIRQQFLEMLEYFGQAPIVVRSSSLLEDGFGNAFAGKYESVFCANQGSPTERYAQFLDAIRTVYASTMNRDALAYRQQRGLADRDEQMAVLVQRVSGAYHGQYFFPDVAGVALSRNLYAWKEELDPAAGMARMVVGLGTRAVNRVGNDYARVAALDRPGLRPDSAPEEVATYTQHRADLFDLDANRFQSISLNELAEANLLPHLALVASRDSDPFGRHEARWIFNFDILLGRSAFPEVLRQMLNTLETAYGYPVDIEFTVNFQSDDHFLINLLQCRPLQIKRNQKTAAPAPQLSDKRVLFRSRGRFMGGNLELAVKRMIVVAPEGYAALPERRKYQVARIIGRLNRLIADPEAEPTVLLGPGRWGTSTPGLGVPVSFAEIDRMAVLGEVSCSTGGMVPDLSYGTHFFQDLVEAGIVYLALDEAGPRRLLDRET